MQVFLGERRARDDEVEFVLVEPRLLHVDVGPDLGDPFGQEVALRDEELAPEDLLRLREMRAQKLVWNVKINLSHGELETGLVEIEIVRRSSFYFSCGDGKDLH